MTGTEQNSLTEIAALETSENKQVVQADDASSITVHSDASEQTSEVEVKPQPPKDLGPDSDMPLSEAAETNPEQAVEQVTPEADSAPNTEGLTKPEGEAAHSAAKTTKRSPTPKHHSWERDAKRLERLFLHRSEADITAQFQKRLADSGIRIESAAETAEILVKPEESPESPSEAAESTESISQPIITEEIASEAAAPSEKEAEEVAEEVAEETTEATSPENFIFARWNKPLVPLFFGLEPASAAMMRNGFERVARVADLQLAEEDPEFGANILFFVCQEWAELTAIPDLERLLPEYAQLFDVLQAAQINQYRLFKTSEAQGITLCLVFLRLDEALSALPPQALALAQASQCLLLSNDSGFASEHPITIGRHGRGILKRWMQRLLEVAYTPDIPLTSQDPALIEQLARAINAPRKRRKPSRNKPQTATTEAAEDITTDEAQSESNAEQVDTSVKDNTAQTDASTQSNKTNEDSIEEPEKEASGLDENPEKTTEPPEETNNTDENNAEIPKELQDPESNNTETKI